MAGMDFSWLPQGQDVSRLPLGMRVNNPGNIKYNPRLGYAGMIGPSGHTDQGDPQMTFDTPANGMKAMASLLRRKYTRGQRTPLSIIAGEGGWTPGNVSAATNVARSLGIGVNDDIGLAEPSKMAGFMKALAKQEHGEASKLYGDDLYAAAAGAPPGEPGPMMAKNIIQRIGTKTEGGVAAAPRGAERLKALLAGGYDPKVSAQADDLIAQGNETAKGAKNWLDVLNTGLATGLGSYQKAQQEGKRKEFEGAFREELGAAQDAKGIARLLMSSPDQATQLKGAAMFADAQAAEQKAAKDAEASYGKQPTFGVDEATGEPVAIGYNNRGQATRIQNPPGVKLSEKLLSVDTGLGTRLVGGTTHGTIADVPKDVAGVEAEKKRGEMQETARQALPSIESRTDRVLERLTRLATDPVRSRFTGWQGYGWNVTPAANSYQGLLDEVGGNTFLAGFSDLRGAGAITEAEGAKAQAALSRLQTIAPSDPGFTVALEDAREVFEEIRRNARTRAGLAPGAGAGAPGDGAAPPATRRLRFNPQTGGLE